MQGNKTKTVNAIKIASIFKTTPEAFLKMIDTLYEEGMLMSKQELKFEFEKETKNSVRFKEVPAEGKPPIVGTLYVQKWFAGNAKEVKVSIELGR